MFQVRNASANPPFLSERPAKRRRDLEDTMIYFMKTPIPNVPAPKPNDDRSFFQSLIAIVSTFNVEQKLDFRSGVLDFAKKIRLSVIHTATHTQHNVPQEQHFPSQNQPRVPWQYPLCSMFSCDEQHFNFRTLTRRLHRVCRLVSVSLDLIVVHVSAV